MMFHGVHTELQPKIGATNAALSTTVMAGILIVAPAVTLVSVFAREVPPLHRLPQERRPRRRRIGSSRSGTSSGATARWGCRRIRPRCCATGVQRALAFLAPRAGAVVADAFATIGSLFVMLFALFFLLRDGEQIGTAGARAAAAARARTRAADRRDTDLVIASVGAGLLVAAVQGAIGGLAFWALGIGAPVVWGVVMALCALIPAGRRRARVGADRAVDAALGRDHARHHPRHRRRAVHQHGRQRAAAAAAGRPHVGERTRRVPRPARRRRRVRIHRPGRRPDHPGHGREPDSRVHAARPGRGVAAAGDRQGRLRNSITAGAPRTSARPTRFPNRRRCRRRRLSCRPLSPATVPARPARRCGPARRCAPASSSAAGAAAPASFL